MPIPVPVPVSVPVLPPLTSVPWCRQRLGGAARCPPARRRRRRPPGAARLPPSLRLPSRPPFPPSLPPSSSGLQFPSPSGLLWQPLLSSGHREPLGSGLTPVRLRPAPRSEQGRWRRAALLRQPARSRCCLAVPRCREGSGDGDRAALLCHSTRGRGHAARSPQEVLPAVLQPQQQQLMGQPTSVTSEVSLHFPHSSSQPSL